MLFTVFRNLSKRGRQRQRREARKIFLSNPYILLSISLLWLPCMFLFSLKLLWLQRLLLNETMDASSWNVGHVLKTAWGSSWSLIWGQDGTNISFISHNRVRFLSCVISLIVLSMLPSPSSAVFLKVPKLYQHSFLVYVKAKNINWGTFQWFCLYLIAGNFRRDNLISQFL